MEASTAQPRRLALGGLHHVTLIVKDVRRSVDFYRNVLGLRLVKQTVNEDDRSARHLFFGDEEGRPGTMITCLEYPQLDEGTVGVGSTHHVAFSVGSDEELEGWRAYLESRGVQCTEVLDRTYFRSVYLRDPDGHILELATAGPGMTVDEPLEQLGHRAVPRSDLGDAAALRASPYSPAGPSAPPPPSEPTIHWGPTTRPSGVGGLDEKCPELGYTKFATEDDADEVVEASRRRYQLGEVEKPLDQSYVCGYCSWWHVSSTPEQ